MFAVYQNGTALADEFATEDDAREFAGMFARHLPTPGTLTVAEYDAETLGVDDDPRTTLWDTANANGWSPVRLDDEHDAFYGNGRTITVEWSDATTIGAAIHVEGPDDAPRSFYNDYPVNKIIDDLVSLRP